MENKVAKAWVRIDLLRELTADQNKYKNVRMHNKGDSIKSTFEQGKIFVIMAENETEYHNACNVQKLNNTTINHIAKINNCNEIMIYRSSKLGGPGDTRAIGKANKIDGVWKFEIIN